MKRAAIAFLVGAVLTWGRAGLAAAPVTATGRAGAVFEQQTVFESGRGGYTGYRIPALVVATNGTILAFCEARKNSLLDDGDIDLVLRRSEDGGRTWSPMEILADAGSQWMGSPAPVVDRDTGVVWLMFTQSNTRTMLLSSGDNGKTWGQPVEITKDTKDPSWAWFIPGPGHGIQLRNGRLLVPSWALLQEPTGSTVSVAIYSDDHGRTWKRGQPLTFNASDECQAVELSDGRLYLTLRNHGQESLPGSARGQRGYAFSRDGGETWTPVQFDARLPEPKPQYGCQGSVLRWTPPGAGGKAVVLFANPASTETRKDLTVRLSEDDGRTWPVAKIVDDLTDSYTDRDWDRAAYSDMAVDPRGDVLLLSEASNYRKINLTRFNLPWLTDSGAPDHLVLMDEDPALAAALTEVTCGAGTAEWITGDRFAGQGCLRITPWGRYATRVKGWRYRIREKPHPGEYRYLRFAWKSVDGRGINLQVAADGVFSANDQAARSYCAGPSATSWAARSLSPDLPREWTVVTVDLWKDAGEFTLTGIAPTAVGGPALLDRLELLRSLDQ